MIRHRYTLEHIVRECREEIVGTFISDCFTQEKNILMFECTAGRHEIWLECSVDAQYGAVFLKKDFARARRNSMDFFPQLIGQQIKDITLHPTDRILSIRTNNYLLHILCFSGGSGNILLYDAQAHYVDAYKPKNLTSEKLREIDNVITGIDSIHFHINSLTTESELTEYLLSHLPATIRSNELQKSLLSIMPELGKYYCDYILKNYESNTDKESIDFAVLSQSILNCYKECCTSTKFLCLNSGKDYTFSLLNFDTSSSIVFSASSVSEGIRRTISFRKREQRRNELFVRLNNILEQKLKRLRRTIDLLENEELSQERLQHYRLWAEILISLPNGKVKPESNTYETHDWDNNTIVIPVSQEKTIIENAERYYEKIRSAQTASKIRKQRLPKYKKEYEQLYSYREVIQHNPTIDDLEKISQQLSVPIKKSMDTNKNSGSKFRTFPLDDGFVLYVGKNAANNDELTMKFAKQNDIWLHARGVSGSHAILKITGKEKPTKRILEQAAEITAYYSSARNASYTPVAYTERKYVRKPKGANPGAVVIEREKVIMVSPKLPVGAEAEE